MAVCMVDGLCGGATSLSGKPSAPMLVDGRLEQEGWLKAIGHTVPGASLQNPQSKSMPYSKLAEVTAPSLDEWHTHEPGRLRALPLANRG
jgi:formylmethanofuran dehydrogenase subunit A